MADEVQLTVEGVPDGATHSSIEQPTEVAEDGVDSRIPVPSEDDALLSVQTANSNGETHTVQAQSTPENNSTPHEESAVSRVKRELNEYAFMKVRVWMLLVALCVVVVLVIVISVAACSATQVDVDDVYDPTLFVVRQSFSGNFTLPNRKFTEELLNLNSAESQTLATELQNKLADLYRSSPALERYFNKSEITGFRNDPFTAEYSLTFMLPEEELDELRNITVSKEMVYNVFRQFLFDQESASESLYIEPISLKMSKRQ